MNAKFGQINRGYGWRYFLTTILCAGACLTMPNSWAGPNSDKFVVSEDGVFTQKSPGVLVNDTPSFSAGNRVSRFQKLPFNFFGFSNPGTTLTTDTGAKVRLRANGSLRYDPGQVHQSLAEGVVFNETSGASDALLVYSQTKGGFFAAFSTANINIAVVGANDLPTDIGLSNNSIEENSIGTVGILTGIDIDDEAPHGNHLPVYTLVSGAGDTDNSLFTIVDDVLSLSEPLDFETEPNYSIRIRITDPHDGRFEKVFTIALIDVGEHPPVAIDDLLIVNELTSPAASIDVLNNDTDADFPGGGEVLTVIEVSGNPGLVDSTAFDIEVDGQVVGVATMASTGLLTFLPTADATVETRSVDLSYKIADSTGAESALAVVSIEIEAQNDNAPQLTESGEELAASGYSFVEYQATRAPDSVLLHGLFFDIDIDADGLLDEDLSDDNESLDFTVVDNSSPEIVLAEIEDAGILRLSSPNLHFYGTSTLTIRATDTAEPDGNISSVDLVFDVTVVPVNDAPVYTGIYSSATVAEDLADFDVPLATAFNDADLTDNVPNNGSATDEELTYVITIVDRPSPFVASPMIVVPDDSTALEVDGETTFVLTTTALSNLQIDVKDDVHGVIEVSVSATDRSGETALASFKITVLAVDNDIPVARDDHFDDFPELNIAEGSNGVVFDVLANDDAGDVPTIVVSAGQQIVDSLGEINAFRSTSRLSDPNDSGDFRITINGEVGCASTPCVDGITTNSAVNPSAIGDRFVIYKPIDDFNGVDFFSYCIEDSANTLEPEFVPNPADAATDIRCATVTVNVLPVNDKPIVNTSIIFSMEQSDRLVASVEDGLRNFVDDKDNTHIDGLGCDPLLASCTPALDRQPDQLYYYFDSSVTPNGNLIAPFADDGSFVYEPNSDFFGSDEFTFQVCDRPTPGQIENCSIGTVIVQVIALQGAAEGSTEEAVEFDYQLADVPLELPIGPEPNVLIVNDDSGSMGGDILTENLLGLYSVMGRSFSFINPASAGENNGIVPPEELVPGAGYWRLRNSTYNSIYYDPQTRYLPWKGLQASGEEYPDSNPVAARQNPVSAGGATTNLTTVLPPYTGQTVEEVSIGIFTSIEFLPITISNYYPARYYTWQDLNVEGEAGFGLLDATPSPTSEPAICVSNRTQANNCSEGILVEIRNDGSLYPRGEDRTDCIASASSCNYNEEIKNFANWFSYYRTREFVAKAALGEVVSTAQNLRVGYALLNDRLNAQPIKLMNTSARTGNKAALLNTIYATDSRGGTPLRLALRDAGRHFECKADDLFDSAADSLPGAVGCPILAAPLGNCQQNYTLLISDGGWNGGAPGLVGDNADADGDSNFDGGAFAGSAVATLADVSMNFYEKDLHTGLADEVPTTARDRDTASETAFFDAGNDVMHQHMSTFMVGFGVSGDLDADPVDYTASFPWGDPQSDFSAKIDDMRHAAYNGRGRYLDASDGADLAARLVDAFSEFAQGSGAASAVSFNSQEVQEDTLIFRAFYNTKINTGDLIAQTLSTDGITEEPVWSAAAELDTLSSDDREILSWDPDAAKGIRFRPNNGCPVAGSCLNLIQESIFVSDPMVTAAERNDEILAKVNYLRGNDENERPTGNLRERPVENGRLGDVVHSTPVFVGPPNRVGRDQAAFPQTDLYSVFRAANASRQKMIYVAANDGMLHGISAEDGSEVFAYVPNNLLLGTFSNNITQLLSFDYIHKFFVDLTPAVNDIYLDVDGDGDEEWSTVLVGGQGAGAKAYFALNVTDPAVLTESSAADVVLWEFTDDDDTYPTDAAGIPLVDSGGLQRLDLQDVPRPIKDMGYSFSVPSLVMSNVLDASSNNEWVAIFGNGYNSTSGIAKLFLLFIDRGVDGLWCHPDMRHNIVLNGTLPTECIGKQDFVKIDTTFGVQGGFPNGLGIPRAIDIDGNGTVDYVYAGDTFGNFFRFDLTSSNFDDWNYTKIFKAEYTDSGGNVFEQPITTQPIVVRHPTEPEGFIVIFSTGSYITLPDGADEEIQSIYGIWDRLTPELLDIADMVQQKYTNKISSEFGAVRILSNNDVDYSVIGDKKGWYNHLQVPAAGESDLAPAEFPGERAIRNIQLRGGLAFVNSIIPRSDTSCIDVAGGFALSFCPATGGTSCLEDGGIFDLNNDGEFDDNDDVDGEIVAGLRFEDAVPTDSSFIGDERITQLSDQSLDSTTTNTGGGLNTGRLSWKQLETVQ
ncbi:MAG: hypothetical protein KUG79_19215 [Pseudomonadales bacterium]|nr:hypothetical protein [Pseudomonadales bacterium]